MGGQYRENYKRIVNKLPAANTSADDTDLVRFQDQHLLTTNASGLGGNVIVGTPSNSESLVFRDGQWVYALTNASGINGNPISSIAPADNQILRFDGTQWVSGVDTANASGIVGQPISSTTPIANQILKFDGTQWSSVTVSSSGGHSFGDTGQLDILQLGSVNSEIFEVSPGIIGFGASNDGATTDAVIKPGRVDATGILFGPQGAAGRIFELIGGRVLLSTADYSALGDLDLRNFSATGEVRTGVFAGYTPGTSATVPDSNDRFFLVNDDGFYLARDFEFKWSSNVGGVADAFLNGDSFMGRTSSGILYIGATTGTADGILNLALVDTTAGATATQISLGRGLITTPAIAFDTTTGFYSSGANQFTAVISGSDLVTFTAASLGINTDIDLNDNDLLNAANVHVAGGGTGDLIFDSDTYMSDVSAGVLQFGTTPGSANGILNLSTLQHTGFIQGTEMTAPSAGAANTGRIFFEDNGGGKTRLMVRFATGAVQQIAIEP